MLHSFYHALVMTLVYLIPAYHSWLKTQQTDWVFDPLTELSVLKVWKQVKLTYGNHNHNSMLILLMLAKE